MLNQGIVPRLPIRRRGHWRRVSVMELIHDYWPGRPSENHDTAFMRVTDQIWSTNREDNRKIDQQYGLGLGDFGYY
jgi:hypothetical protein